MTDCLFQSKCSECPGMQPWPFSHQWLLFEPCDKMKVSDQEAYSARSDKLYFVMWFPTVQRCGWCVGGGKKGSHQVHFSCHLHLSYQGAVPGSLWSFTLKPSEDWFITLFLLLLLFCSCSSQCTKERGGPGSCVICHRTLLIAQCSGACFTQMAKKPFLGSPLLHSNSDHLDVCESHWGQMPQQLLAVGRASPLCGGLCGL